MSAPINVFRTVTALVDNIQRVVYIAPPNNTAILLMAQITNTALPDVSDLSNPDPNNVRVDFGIFNQSPNFPGVPGFLGSTASSPSPVQRRLVSNFLLPPSQTADLLAGKLVIAENEQLFAYTTSAPNAPVEIILSVLEARNA